VADVTVATTTTVEVRTERERVLYMQNLSARMGVRVYCRYAGPRRRWSSFLWMPADGQSLESLEEHAQEAGELYLARMTKLRRQAQAKRDAAKQRARHDRYRGVCEVCGGPTGGSNGPGKAPRFCKRCHGPAHARWTSEAIIAAIQAWTERFGAPPTATEWNPTAARNYVAAFPNRPSAERLSECARIVVEEDWPRSNTVRLRFGTWSAAIRAAGFETRGSE
jgi:hypothetical protein